MQLVRSSLVLVLCLAGACSSKITETIDGTLQRRLDTVRDCLPPLYGKAAALLAVANSWRMNTSAPVPDPPGLTWSENIDGTVQVDYDVGQLGTTIVSMLITFYSPTGTPFDATLNPPGPLSQAIDDAATELRNQFPGANPFMVGDWTITGAGLTGSGTFTGIIGGVANQNELEELRTTTATPAGGPPPFASCQITLVAAQTCDLTFGTTGLETDTVVDQQYPIGVVDITLVGEATVDATITMNNTVIARIDVGGVPGHFELNLDTFAVAYVAP